MDYCWLLFVVALISLLLFAAHSSLADWFAKCCLCQCIQRLVGSQQEEEADIISRRIAELIPAFKYTKAMAQRECAVCLGMVVEGEEVRQLPGCKHSFHVPCIDMWLSSHANCPTCRADVLPGVSRGRRSGGDEEEGMPRSNLIVTGGGTSIVFSI